MKREQPASINPSSRMRPSGVRRFCAAALLAMLLLWLQTQNLPAPSGTWLSTASGNWSDPANWAGGVIADGAGNNLIGQSLPTGATRTITVDTPRTIGTIQMDCNGTGRTYVFAGTNAITLSRPGNIPLVQALNGRLRITVPLDGTEGARFRARNAGGNAEIYLEQPNLYSGNTQIIAGPARIAHVNAIPTGVGKGNVVLLFEAAGRVATLDLLTNNITINGLVSVLGNDLVVTSSATDAGMSILTLGNADATATYGGQIVDGPVRQMALTKIGSGTQVLAGPNSYTGPTTVEAGALIVNSNLYSPVTVNGGLLGGSGPFFNSVSVNAGGTISAGSSVGIMQLQNGLDLSAGGTNLWELIANSDANPGSDFDQIQLVTGTLDLSDATLLVSLGGSVNPADPFWSSPRSWDIITSFFGSGSSNFKAVKVQGSAPAGTFTTTNDGTNVKLLFTPGGAPPQPPPTPVRITAITGVGGPSVTVHYTNTIPGSNYVLQAANSLTAPVSWANVSTNQASGTSGSGVDNTAAGQPQRYYRVFYHYSP